MSKLREKLRWDCEGPSDRERLEKWTNDQLDLLDQNFDHVTADEIRQMGGNVYGYEYTPADRQLLADQQNSEEKVAGHDLRLLPSHLLEFGVHEGAWLDTSHLERGLVLRGRIALRLRAVGLTARGKDRGRL